MDQKRKDRPQKPLRATIADIDQEILRLLVRRSNLLAKIRENGHVPPKDEKFLREAWQNDVARVSRDPELSGRFFSLMQQLSFLPKPGGGAETGLPGSQRRSSFNLAPPDLPIDATLTCPLSGWQTQAWLYLAAASGQRTSLTPCLQNDQLVDFVRCLAQMEAAITRDDETIFTRSGSPMGAPDKVIHAGTDEFGLYLIIAHYIGRFSRVKLTGDAPLSLANLSSLRKFLPGLGCRMVNIVPKSDCLPIRLEASGILPPGIAPGPEIPPLFASALLLAAPFYSAPFAVDLTYLQDRAEIRGRALPLLAASGAVFSLNGDTVALEPAQLNIPERARLALEPELAVFLAGFARALGGRVELNGKWPDWPSSQKLWQFCSANGYTKTGTGIAANFAAPATSFSDLPCTGWQAAFTTALAACCCLRGGNAVISEPVSAEAADFLRVTGIEIGADAALAYNGPYSGLPYTAPSPAWACGLALAACCRHEKQGLQLGNPGIVTELWPLFWQFYNSLPRPGQKPKKEAAKEAAPVNTARRRRIVTDVVAVPPALHEEDWD